MTAREALAAIKAALEAGPTDGPWWGDFASMMRNGSPQVVEYFVRRDGDDISIAAEIVNPESGLPSEANAAFIAACNPVAIRALLAEVERLRAELAEVKRDAEHLRSESVTLAGILRDCDSVLATIEPESTAEADSMADLRRAIAYALGPYGDTGNLPGIEPRRRIVFACPVCAASLERTS